MDINPEEVARPEKRQQGEHSNPYFGRVDNGPYHLGYLFRELPPRGKRLSGDTILKAKATRQHAGNGITTLSHGIQAIGGLMVRVGTSEDGDLDATNVTAIGDLIQHLATELRFLSEIDGYMDDLLTERIVAKGGVQ